MLRREKVRKREIGLGYVLCFIPRREKSEKQQDGCGTDLLIFDVLLQDQVMMKETLQVWELLCAFICHMIVGQLLHRNLFIVKDLSVLLTIIQKFCVLAEATILETCASTLLLPG